MKRLSLIRRQIKNRHGQTLAILNNGKVIGIAAGEETKKSGASSSDKNAILEFIPTEPPQAFRIRGIESNLYLAMDVKGRLYGESDRSEGGTVFAEHSAVHVRLIFLEFKEQFEPFSWLSTFQGNGQYYVYLSVKFAHLGWHVGLTKAGKAKRGKRTWYGQKAVQFIRKPIVPVTPHFDWGAALGNNGFDHTQMQLKNEERPLAFIDDDDGGDEGQLLIAKGPTQVRKIAK